MPPRTVCQRTGCEATATVAIRTQRPTRANLWTKVWWTASEAPAAAERLCPNCARETLAGLAEVLA